MRAKSRANSTHLCKDRGETEVGDESGGDHAKHDAKIGDDRPHLGSRQIVGRLHKQSTEPAMAINPSSIRYQLANNQEVRDACWKRAWQLGAKSRQPQSMQHQRGIRTFTPRKHMAMYVVPNVSTNDKSAEARNE